MTTDTANHATGYHGGPAAKLHSLKTWFRPWEAVEQGLKTAEFRRNDRDFRVGDMLHLFMWDPDRKETVRRGGHTLDLFVRVTAICNGHGIPDGFVMLSFARCQPEETAHQMRYVDDLHSGSGTG